jgi:hypothetical protein
MKASIVGKQNGDAAELRFIGDRYLLDGLAGSVNDSTTF